MKLLGSHMKVADIIFHDPAAIPVLNRVGIKLGVGTGTLAQCCAGLGLDAEFVTAILTVSLNDDEDYPQRILKPLGLGPLCDYLLETDRYYIKVQLPNISRHLDSLIRHSGAEAGNLALLRRFFDDLSSELTQRAGKELECGKCFADDWQAVADRISDLLSFFVIHLHGDYDCNLCNGVVSAIFTLAHDLRQTSRLRRHVLHPMLADDDR